MIFIDAKRYVSDVLLKLFARFLFWYLKVLSHIQHSKSSLVSPGMVKSQMSLSALNINDGEVFDETVDTVLPGGTGISGFLNLFHT